ncbi:MAG: transcription antitermination factor NusB [Bacteroidales bacterium]|nr:transcription antitermination factor NusB [Bacteroidales bacterium]
MVSRRYLRTKTMQALYAHSMKPFENALTAEKDLIQTVKDCYTLFLWFFSMLPEVTYYRRNKLEDLKGKHNPTFEDLNPNTKFVDNRIIQQMEDNKTLKVLFPQHHINWTNDTDFIVRLFHEIEESEEYITYMANPERSYEEDRQLVYSIIQNIIANNDFIRWFFGEKNPNWLDDYEEALAMFYKNVGEFKATKGDDCKIQKLFKDDVEDVQFCRELFRKTLEHDAEYEEMIEAKLQNWELDRVIGMDILLMKMAICELLEFPTIPIKVTLNEYIDLAKDYSSDKSKVFVNGILDRMIVDLRDQGKLHKTGRGLYQN